VHGKRKLVGNLRRDRCGPESTDQLLQRVAENLVLDQPVSHLFVLGR